jgi:hypothetical protein
MTSNEREDYDTCLCDGTDTYSKEKQFALEERKVKLGPKQTNFNK